MSAASKQQDAMQQTREQKRGTLERYLGKLFILTTLISFIFVGLLLNCLQLILVLTIKFSNGQQWRRWHKKLHGQIVYAVFSQPVFLLYVWPRWHLEIVLEDMKLMEEVNENIFGVIIANHTYELDWMTCFIMADQLGNMGNYKCFSKDELKWLPIIGWTFWMADLVYVKRDWQRDKPRIAAKLDQLLDYDQILLGIFAEGTRWTPEKHLDAARFAASRSIEPYKHHLFPRHRGFNYTMRHYLRVAASASAPMRTSPVRVFNLQIVMADRPNFSDFLEGNQLRADVYCEEVHLDDELRLEALAARDEDECPKLRHLLQDIFRRKDQLMEEFESNGRKFPMNSKKGGKFPLRRPVRPFIYWLAGMSLTYGTLARLAYSNVGSGSFGHWFAFVLLVVTSGLLLLRRIERESRPTKLNARRQRQTVAAGGETITRTIDAAASDKLAGEELASQPNEATAEAGDKTNDDNSHEEQLSQKGCIEAAHAAC